MILRVTAFVGLLLATATQPAFGQAFTGTITGVVTDPNGAAIPHAKLQVRNEATGEVRAVTGGGDGLYVVSQLPPATYEVSAEIQGFRKGIQTGAVLRVNQKTPSMNCRVGVTTCSEPVLITPERPTTKPCGSAK